MSRDGRRHLDAWSVVVILITLLLFVAALFLKGLGHDLLLEGGVFLVSVKLIMMAYKSSVATTELHDRLDGLQGTLTRIEGLFESRAPSESSERAPNEGAQPPAAGHRAEETPRGSGCRS